MKRILPLLLAVVALFAFLGTGITQEVPLGTIEGRIELGKSKMPLANSLVTISPLTEVVDYQRPRYAETDASGRFRIERVPTGAYVVEVAAQYHSLDTTFVSVEEGKIANLNLQMAPGPDQMSVYNSQRVITPDESPLVEVHGFFRDEAVRYEIRKLDIDRLAKVGSVQSVAYTMAQGRGPAADVLRASPVVREVRQPITNKDAEGGFVAPLKIEPLPEGLYWVTVRAGKLRRDAFLNVSKLSLVTKVAGDQLVCFASDLVSGEPEAGVQIYATGPSGLERLGTTDRHGLLEDKLPRQASENGRTVLGKRGDSVALVGFWGGDPNRADVRLVSYTDRPIYRPGDTIRFKGVVRQVRGAEMSPLRGIPGDVELRDADGEIVSTLRLPLSEHGTFHGEFETSSEAKPGYFSLHFRVGEANESRSIEVAAYRKPEYRVDVRPNGGPFILGQPASVTVDCEYYFGGPVVGAQVKASVYRTRVWEFEDEDYGFDSYSPGAGEYTQELEATTDSAGRAILTFPTRADGDPDAFTYDYRYTVVASVADAGDKYFDGEGSVRVNRGLIDVAVSTDRWFAPRNEPVAVEVSVKDSVDPLKPMAGQEVSLQIEQWRWTENTSVAIPRQTLQARTDSAGLAKFEIPFEQGGDYRLRATSRDADGRTVQSETSLWVEGTPSGRPLPSLKVSLDQKRYAPGDKARVLIETESPGGSALLTVQAMDVAYKEVIPLRERSTVVEIPVNAEYTPNVFVAAAYVREKTFAEDTTRLDVDNDARKLQVLVEPLAPEYQPGEVASVRVKTQSLDGKPVPAEVSVGVVDESIYAIREDSTDIRALLDPRRYDRVQTQYSFPEIYLDGGDKGGGDIPLRKKFEDTAAWRPTVWTGPEGEATLQIPLPDNLTQWRATAIGVADDGASGQSVAKFRARKPLMVRISPPAFLVQGDRSEVSVSVTNDIGRDAEVRLDLSAEGVGLEGERSPRLRLKSGATEAVRVQLSAGAAGPAVLAARAWADATNRDGVEARFAIKPHGRQQTQGTAAEARPEATLSFEVASDADRQVGGLTLSLAPNLAGGIVQSLDELVDFPYGCVEQTMSRFLPAVVVANALQQLGLERPALVERIPKVAADSMARLGRMQHGDGGWGWWEYDESDPFMTALVLDGLDRAARAGSPVRRVHLDGALSWAQRRWKNPDRDDTLRERLYLAYVLRRYRRATPNLEKIDLRQASATDLAMAAMAFHEAGLPTLAMRALDRLRREAQVGPTQTRWEAGKDSWGEEPNALALVAFATIRPQDPIIPAVVRGLMARRRGDIWTSTRDTSYSILGLVTVLAQTQGEAAESVAVEVNGRPLSTVAFDRRRIEGSTLTIPMRDLPQGAVEVKVRASGGVAYVTGTLQQFVVQFQIPPASTDPQLTVRRTYRLIAPRRLEDGTTRLMPSDEPITKAKAGDLIRVDIEIDAKADREYVMVEDSIPSNCRITERADLAPGEEWGWWWSETVLRDDRISFFARRMAKGEHKFVYTMRAENPGTVSALPTHIAPMYEPALWASPAENRLEVVR